MPSRSAILICLFCLLGFPLLWKDYDALAQPVESKPAKEGAEKLPDIPKPVPLKGPIPAAPLLPPASPGKPAVPSVVPPAPSPVPLPPSVTPSPTTSPSAPQPVEKIMEPKSIPLPPGMSNPVQIPPKTDK